MTNKQLFSIATVAKLTRFPYGEKKFFEWLRDHNYLLKNNEPAQFQIDRGWFVLTESKIYDQVPPRLVPTPKITIKGLAGLQRVIEKEFPICPCEET